MLDSIRSKKFSGTKACLYSSLLLLGLAGGSVSMMAQEDVEPAYLPIKTQSPKYPVNALRQGIVGWTVVTLTVDENGDVSDAALVDSCSVPEKYNEEAELDTDGCLLNRDIFKNSSLTAIAGFKFKPRMNNGVAVATPGVQYMFKYSLSETDKSMNEILDQYGARRVPARGGLRN